MQPDEDFWEKFEGEQIANTYELEQLLGCGTYGGVFRAAQIANGKKLEKRVAIKLMLSGKIQQEELNFALNLPSHQNLVQHFTGNNVEISRLKIKMFYLVMELADCSLADFLKKRGGRISSVEAKAIVRDIAQGLKFLHELDDGNSQDKRYVHRDLKLLNVLQVGGVWKIADFGLSKALDLGTIQTSETAGTRHYMPPELFRDGYVSTKWDVWSLGVMIVEMLTAHFPFEAGGNGNTEVVIKELERKIERENPNLQGVTSEWLDIVKGCLVKDHARRWVAADVLKALDSIGVSIPQNNPPITPQPNPSSQKTTPVHASPSSSNGLWSKALAIALISSIVFMIWQLVRPVNSPTVIISPSGSPSPKEPVSSKTAEEFFNDGVIKSNAKDYKGAIADYNEAIRLNPSIAEAYINRGIAKRDLGDRQAAIADFNEAIRLQPNYPNAFNARGDSKSYLGDKQGAIADFNEAIRLKPDFASAYNNRGNAKKGLGNKQGAITDYNEAIRLDPSAMGYYYNRGNTKSDLGDKQGAIADYNEAIRLKPDSADAYNNRGLAKSALGDKQGAISDYNEAIRLKPALASAYFNRGVANNTLRNYGDSVIDFTKAIEFSPNEPNYYTFRGNSNFNLGKEKEAILDHTKAIEIAPSFAPAYFNRGIARQIMGDNGGAITDFNESIRLKPDSGSSYFYRGLAKKVMGDKQSALVDIREAARLYQQQGDTEWYNISRDIIKELGG